MQPSAIRIGVSDSEPLIALGRLDWLAVLSVVFREGQVPRDVLIEWLRALHNTPIAFPTCVRMNHIERG